MCHRMATRVIRCSLVALKILDRYLVRQIVPPMLLALVGLTFVLMMPPIMQNAAKLIELITQHTALLVASPEYNSMITPLLKNTASIELPNHCQSSPPRSAR